MPGESGPRLLAHDDRALRAVTDAPYASDGNGDFRTVGGTGTVWTTDWLPRKPRMSRPRLPARLGMWESI